MNKKIILCIFFVVIAIICGYFLASAKYSDSDVLVKNHQIIKGSNNWNQFKENTKNGKADTIHIIIDDNGGCYDNVLSFDGDYYQYINKQEGSTSKRKFLLDLTEENPATNQITRWVVLADKQYSLKDLTHSIESSSSQDWIEFDIIFLD